jgi:anaphase-promoting complex subunit 5
MANECRMLTSIARENQDSACLNFALSWLLYLRHAHPNQDHTSYGSISGVVGSSRDEQDEITFLKTKARDSKHWVLLSSTLLEEARFEMFSVSRSTENTHRSVLTTSVGRESQPCLRAHRTSRVPQHTTQLTLPRTRRITLPRCGS